MYGTKNVKQLTVDEILKRVSEYDIFRYYIGKDFRMGTIRSPLRKDRDPSFDIFPSPDTVRKIMYKDHASGDKGSCFDLIMRMYGVTFFQALQIIDNDFNLGLGRAKSVPKKTTMGYIGERSNVDVSKLAVQARFRVIRREWNATTDKDFWTKYGLTVEVLEKFNVSPISALQVNYNWFRFKKDEPVYCFHFGNYIYKIYNPFDEEHKWATNAPQNVLQGWHQLPETGDFVVITKSLKDVMVYYMLGIPAIAPQGEAIIPNPKVIDNLRSRFKTIISNYDYDRRGMLSAKMMRDRYDIRPIMFTNYFDEKDASDFVEAYGLEALQELILDVSNGETFD